MAGLPVHLRKILHKVRTLLEDAPHRIDNGPSVVVIVHAALAPAAVQDMWRWSARADSREECGFKETSLSASRTNFRGVTEEVHTQQRKRPMATDDVVTIALYAASLGIDGPVSGVLMDLPDTTIASSQALR